MPVSGCYLLAVLWLFGCCALAETADPAVVSEEAAVVGELEHVGASFEFNQQGQAISLFLGVSHGKTFTDQHLQLVGKLKHLRELWLEHSAVTDAGLAELKPLSRLRTLVLLCEYEPGQPAKITDVGLRHLAGLTNLRMLRLDDADITDWGLIQFRSLTNLEDLGLFGTEISDDGLIYLRGLKKLTYLDVAETQWETRGGAITVQAVRSLQPYLPHCQIDY